MTTLAEMQVVARKLGLQAEARQMTVKALRRGRSLGVLHIDGHHFVALVGYDPCTLHIAETGYNGPPQVQRWSDGDLMTRWDGTILIIRKSP